MAEGIIKKLTNKGFGFIDTGAKKTCSSTHRASKVSLSRNCVKAKRCPTRKAGGRKARVPKTSSRYSSAGTLTSGLVHRLYRRGMEADTAAWGGNPRRQCLRHFRLSAAHPWILNPRPSSKRQQIATRRGQHRQHDRTGMDCSEREILGNSSHGSAPLAGG